MMHAVGVGGAEIAVEVRGPDEGPPMLLVAGLGWSMDWWDEDLVDRLAARGHRVIRYDHRDTGASTTWPRGAPGYTFHDMVTDAVAVLDAVGARQAHVVGLSMGGAIAQYLALTHRDRVRALTLVATSSDDPALGELPASEPVADPVPADDPVEALVEAERPYAGPVAFDEARTRAIAERVVLRSRDAGAGAANHWRLERGSLPQPVELARFAGLRVLVIHGDADPMFPIAHGRALAATIPGARLLELPGVGHQLPPERTWDDVVDAVTELG